jgi:Acyclic terpene utilisation family protein AtuA
MLRMGAGSGFSSDRLQPAIDLARDGALDWLVFETIGERTLAFGHRDRKLDPAKGYNPQLAKRLRGVLQACRDNRTRIMTNMGVANVPAAAEIVVDVARELGLMGLKVAAVLGDEVTELMTPETVLFDYGGRSLAEVGRPLVGANVYLGIDAILPAVRSGADIVITGRVADPSMFLAPLADHYDWAADDWVRLGKGTLVGHLMECGMQVTGGYFADPGHKDVPRLADCGYPIAEVDAAGDADITKLAGTGGAVTERTVKEQMLYEVHDPARYLTPDVTADFSSVEIRTPQPDRVHVSAASGTERPRQLKVTVGFDGGYLGEAGVSYAGPGAVERAELAVDILKDLLDRIPGAKGNYRIDLIGLNALHQTARDVRQEQRALCEDVRVRVALRSMDRSAAELMLWEVEALLCCGPAGGGGYRGQITPGVVTHSAMIDRDAVTPRIDIFEA